MEKRVLSFNLIGCIVFVSIDCLVLLCLIIHRVVVESNPSTTACRWSYQCREVTSTEVEEAAVCCDDMCFRSHKQLTSAVQSIPIQLVACPTAAVEATNRISTVVFTPSIVGGTLINICIKWNYQLTRPTEPLIENIDISCRHRQWKKRALSFNLVGCIGFISIDCLVLLCLIIHRVVVESNPSTAACSWSYHCREVTSTEVEEAAVSCNDMCFRSYKQLTSAVQSIPIQLVACPTAAAEATNRISTVVFTPSIVGSTLINVCIKWIN